ncbi:MAG: hypothetical protein ACO1TE_05210 [Prosthecobacter sp.]
MQTTVVERIAALEKAVADLNAKIGQPKDWRKAVGMLRDTPLAREADQLGREYRTKQAKP